MNRYHNQRLSEMPKNPDNPSHTASKEIISRILREHGWSVMEGELGIKSNTTFIGDIPPEMRNILDEQVKREKLSYMNYIHNYDIFAVKQLRKTEMPELLIVEVDGSIHDGIPQKINDIIAEDFAGFYIKDAYFVRISTDNIVDSNGKQINDDEMIVKELNHYIVNKYSFDMNVI